MSKYIDADALKENMRGEFIDSIEERIAIREIDSAPSIDIVRCKECKYEKRCTTNVHFIADNGLDVIPVHFCSYGEREGE